MSFINGFIFGYYGGLGVVFILVLFMIGFSQICEYWNMLFIVVDLRLKFMLNVKNGLLKYLVEYYYELWY